MVMVMIVEPLVTHGAKTVLMQTLTEVFASGAAEPRGLGGQLTPTFSGAGSTYGCGPPLFVRISWCMNAADNTFKLSDL